MFSQKFLVRAVTFFERVLLLRKRASKIQTYIVGSYLVRYAIQLYNLFPYQLWQNLLLADVNGVNTKRSTLISEEAGLHQK